MTQPKMSPEAYVMSLAERLDLAADLHTNDDELEELIKTGETLVRQTVAERSPLPIVIADRLAYDPDDGIRKTVASSRLSEHAYRSLAMDPSPKIRAALLACPTLPIAEAEQLVTDLLKLENGQLYLRGSMPDLVRRADVTESLLAVCAVVPGNAPLAAANVCRSLATACALAAVRVPNVALALIKRFAADVSPMAELARHWSVQYHEPGRPGLAATNVILEMARNRHLPDEVLVLLPADAVAAYVPERVRSLAGPAGMTALALADASTQPLGEIIAAAGLLAAT